MVGSLGGVAVLFLIGRYLDVNAVGKFSYALSLVGLFSFLGSLGIDAAHVKRVSEGKDVADRVRTYAVLKLVLSLSFAVLATGAALAWDAWRGFDDTTLPIILVMVVYSF